MKRVVEIQANGGSATLRLRAEIVASDTLTGDEVERIRDEVADALMQMARIQWGVRTPLSKIEVRDYPDA